MGPAGWRCIFPSVHTAIQITKRIYGTSIQSAFFQQRSRVLDPSVRISETNSFEKIEMEATHVKKGEFCRAQREKWRMLD
ncbi:hypothetical protein GUJ93_ZPchr0011g26900 [Zizania palustris]|uniref:Uncharacterized protein n=1 Tax=Zizania palustris TaxID=103762 RepID=A0A8J5WK04_ZIZPA|nr:hypothetical protein GUJ93_ZPchr0011g26900 [Zizania palustris]